MHGTDEAVETHPQQLVRMVVYVIPHGTELDQDEAEVILNSDALPDGFDCRIAEFQQTELDWHDGHELNKIAATPEQFAQYFKPGPNGEVFVDRPRRPPTELEAENERLKERVKQLEGKVLQARLLVGDAKDALEARE